MLCTTKNEKEDGRMGAHGAKPIFFATESAIYKLVYVGPFLSANMVFLFYRKKGVSNIVELMNTTPKAIWTALTRTIRFVLTFCQLVAGAVCFNCSYSSCSYISHHLVEEGYPIRWWAGAEFYWSTISVSYCSISCR